MGRIKEWEQVAPPEAMWVAKGEVRAWRSWKGARVYREWRSPAIDGQLATPTSSPVGAIGSLTALRSVRTIIVVKDGAGFGRAQFDMRNVG